VLSLAGEWRFALDRGDAGVTERWFNRDLADRIQLPGVLQAQGYGDEISPTTPWVAALGDAWWKLQPASLATRCSICVTTSARAPRSSASSTPSGTPSIS
jgi:beta-galactosidase/beta-glucuronidase